MDDSWPGKKTDYNLTLPASTKRTHVATVAIFGAIDATCEATVVTFAPSAATSIATAETDIPTGATFDMTADVVGSSPVGGFHSGIVSPRCNPFCHSEESSKARQ